jgi:GGDEF domain-containing protein
VVVFGQTSRDSTQLIHEADLAMYEAKRQGKGHCVVHS